MRRAGLPYNIVGGFSFYERMEVRDIISYLKLALNPNDSIALQRVINSPPRGIGKQTVEEIEKRAKDYDLSLWETISLVIEKPESLAPRAIVNLKNFRRIIENLALKASGEPDGLVTEEMEKSAFVGLDFDEAALEQAIPFDSHSPVSDLVKAAIFDTGYEAALRAERSDEADARLENLQELVNAAVDYDEQGP